MRLIWLLVLCLLAHGCTRETIEQRMANAERFVSEKDYNSALVSLKNVAQEAPSHIRARTLLAQTQFAIGAFAEAEKESRRALELGALPDDVVPFLAQAIYYQDDYQRLLSEAADFPKLTQKLPKNTVGLVTFLSTIKSGEYQGEDVTPIPEYLDGDARTLAKAYQALAVGSPQVAEGLLSTFTLPTLYKFEKKLLEGTVYAFLQEPVKSAVAFNEALDIYPNYYVAQFLLAEQLINDKQYDRALEEIEALLNVNSNSAYANLLKAKVFFLQEDYETALSFANLGLQSTVPHQEASFIAGVSAYKTGRLESALRYLSTAANTLPPGHVAHRILSQVKLELGYVEDVVTNLDNLNPSDLESAEIYGLAALQRLQMGQYSQANQYIDKANALDANNAANLLRKGVIGFELNQDDATDSLSKAIESDPTLSEGWVLLANAEYEKNGLDAAVSVAKDWQALEPVKGLLLEGILLLKDKKYVRSEQTFVEALKRQPNHMGALRYLTILTAQTERYDRAFEYGKQLVELSPDSLQNIVDLVNIMIGLNETNSITPYLQTLINDNPGVAAPKSALGLLYSWLGRHNETIELLGYREQKPTHFSTYMVLGDAYLKNKNYEKAIEVYDDWTDTIPNDNRGWLRLITSYQLADNIDKAVDATRRAQDYFPRYKPLKLLEANLLMNKGLITQSKAIMSQLKVHSGELADFNQVNGILALNEKRYDDAVASLLQNYQDNPSFYSARMLAFAYQGLNQPDQGIDVLKEELSKLQTPYLERHIFAEYSAANKFFSEAISQYETLLDRDSDDFPALNNYANTLANAGQLEAALPIAQKAFALAPKSPYAMDTLGIVLLRLGQLEEGKNHIQQALHEDPNNIQVQLHMVEALVATEDVIAARSMLSRVRPQSATSIERKRELESLIEERLN